MTLFQSPAEAAEYADARASLPGRSTPPRDTSAGPAPAHISDVIHGAYTPEVYGLYDDAGAAPAEPDVPTAYDLTADPYGHLYPDTLDDPETDDEVTP